MLSKEMGKVETNDTSIDRNERNEVGLRLSEAGTLAR